MEESHELLRRHLSALVRQFAGTIGAVVFGLLGIRFAVSRTRDGLSEERK